MTAVLEISLPGGTRAAAAARHALDELGKHIGAELLENVRLLVSELVTNSIRHSGVGRRGKIALKVRVNHRKVRAEVCDPGPGFEARVEIPTVGQTSGWGLFLVEQIADAWGVDARDPTCVWFEIALPAGRSA